MGTDIHVNLEYIHPLMGVVAAIESGFSISRDYDLFNALAGVRHDDCRPPLFPPRGLPDDVSWEIFERFAVEVIPRNSGDDRKNKLHEWCYADTAEHYIEHGHSQILWRGGQKYVTEPDSHSSSYLTHPEIISACEHYGYDLADAPREFSVLLGFMKILDAEFGPDSSRVVFWFDN